MYLLCLFGLIVTTPVLWWRITLAREVRASIAALERGGNPVTLAQLDNLYSGVPAEENGAELYFAAARSFHAATGPSAELLPFFGAALVESDAPLSPATVAAMETLVSENQESIRLLGEAAGMPSARYILSYGSRPDLPHLEPVKPLAPLLCCLALHHLEQGRTAESVAALTDALALCRSLSRDGYFASLKEQWAMEAMILRVLERLLFREDPIATDLSALEAHFSEARRLAELEAVFDVERGLFIARVREGRNRGLFQQAILSAGVGDLNLLAYLEIAEAATQWGGGNTDARQAIEERCAARLERCERHPLLYVTLLRFPPPCFWEYYRAEFRQVAVAELALSAYRYRRQHGDYPGGAPGAGQLPGVVLESSADGMIVRSVESGEPSITFRLPRNAGV